MSNARLLRESIEALIGTGTQKARLLRHSIESLIGGGTGKARSLRQSVEVLVGTGTQKARSLRQSVEVLVGSGEQKARLNRISIEVLFTTPPVVLCGKIVKVAGAAWRLIGASARVKTTSSSGDIRLGVSVLLPGASSVVAALSVPMTIAEGELESTGGVPAEAYKILPIGTLVSTYTLARGAGAQGLTTELHYRTRVVAQ